MTLEYDGSGYHGFQRQDSLPSIAPRVESALSTLFGHAVTVVAAGRTDAGVHATGQVISCTTQSLMPLKRIPVAASALLRPFGIAVVDVQERAPNFSARRNARARTYRYRILNRVAPSPLNAHRAFHVSATLDIEAMRRAAAHLIGTHDFAAFCAAESQEKSTRRDLKTIDIAHNGDFLDLVLTADSFVHNMVRIIAGTLIEVGRGRRSVDSVRTVLATGNRAEAGFTAPAHGLYLESVEYEPEA